MTGCSNARHRSPIQCIVPPYMLDHLSRSSNTKVRDRAIAGISKSAAVRAVRAFARDMPGMMAVSSPAATKNRLVYDAKGKDTLPGKLVRSEGQKKLTDAAVNEAYDFAGDTYDFYRELFDRNSLDNSGMTLISSVHVGEPNASGTFQSMDNAFWDGAQMAYGDGDGQVFERFTRSLDVVAHELTHGVQSFTSNLIYRGQSGALNEHFSDVFGILVRQWKLGEKAEQASWLIGAEVLVPAKTRRAIRDMENPGTAYADDPDLGTDPQPSHMKSLYAGASDNGGVHLNSGIPNRAFAFVARELGGFAWEIAGRIWYDAMLQLSSRSQFADMAAITLQFAADEKRFGKESKKIVAAAWKKVGL
ncbi:MAG: M4 family metallopeptidase [Planctomycetia bacterium]|nr:M4 family metallopeptidase [Planctomycetia bacterium]